MSMRTRFAIMGSGAVGGYFGGRLAAAGFDVVFIARGAHLAAIRARGLAIESALGDVRIDPAKATDSPAEVGPVDVVLFATKLWDTESAGAACRPLIGPRTAVISLQNGVEAEARLAAMLGPAHVMGGVAQIAAAIAAPGRIEHTGGFANIIFGEIDGRRTARAEALLAALTEAGIGAALADDIVKAIWEKFVFLVGLSGVTGVTRRTIGPIREEPRSRALLTEIVAETAAVARAGGVALDDGVVAERLAFIDGLPAAMTSSMARDLTRGTRLELDWLSGAVVRLGRERGVDTPANAFVAAALALSARGDGG